MNKLNSFVALVGFFTMASYWCCQVEGFKADLTPRYG